MRRQEAVKSNRTHRGLWVVGVVEAVSFAALLVNMVAGDSHSIAAAVGLVHGCVYLASLVVAWKLAGAASTRYLAVLPGIGALLLARSLQLAGA